MFKASDVFFLVAVIISFIISTILWMTGNMLESIFVAIWVPSILAFAIYFKLLSLKARFIKHVEDTNQERNLNE